MIGCPIVPTVSLFESVLALPVSIIINMIQISVSNTNDYAMVCPIEFSYDVSMSELLSCEPARYSWSLSRSCPLPVERCTDGGSFSCSSGRPRRDYALSIKPAGPESLPRILLHDYQV